MSEDPTLEALLAGMTEDQRQAMGREIFGPPAEESVSPAADQQPSLRRAHLKAGGEPSELLEKTAVEQGHSLATELRPAVVDSLQQACNQALSAEHLLLLDIALSAMDSAFDERTSGSSNPAFVTALEEAINRVSSDYFMKSPLGPAACNAVERTLVNTVVAAGELAVHPDRRHWCDTRKFYSDAVRLAGLERPSDEEKSYHTLLSRLVAQPLLRCRSSVPSARSVLDLMSVMPNFAEPITAMAEQVALQRLRRGTTFRPAPVLLLGPPGVGKSHFAQALAGVLGSTVHTLQLASQSNGWILGGLDRGWSGARAGQVFETLAYGDTMAPVVVLDELDKVNADARNHPLGPLYALLEPETAQKFQDEYVEFSIDASQIIWLATANDEQAIPPALLSRFMVFHIAAPADDALHVVLQSMYQKAVAGVPGAPSALPQQWRARCRDMSLRACRQAINNAVGRAVLRAEMQGVGAVELLPEDLAPTQQGRRNRMGFGLN